MKTCECGAKFTTTLDHVRCWECRNLAGAPNRRPLPNHGPFNLADWWGIAGIGTTG